MGEAAGCGARPHGRRSLRPPVEEGGHTLHTCYMCMHMHMHMHMMHMHMYMLWLVMERIAAAAVGVYIS